MERRSKSLHPPLLLEANAKAATPHAIKPPSTTQTLIMPDFGMACVCGLGPCTR